MRSCTWLYGYDSLAIPTSGSFFKSVIVSFTRSAFDLELGIILFK